MPPKRNSMGNKKTVNLPETLIIQHGAHEGSNVSGEVRPFEIDESYVPRTSRDMSVEIQQQNSKKNTKSLSKFFKFWSRY